MLFCFLLFCVLAYTASQTYIHFLISDTYIQHKCKYNLSVANKTDVLEKEPWIKTVKNSLHSILWLPKLKISSTSGKLTLMPRSVPPLLSKQILVKASYSLDYVHQHELILIVKLNQFLFVWLFNFCFFWWHFFHRFAFLFYPRVRNLTVFECKENKLRSSFLMQITKCCTRSGNNTIRNKFSVNILRYCLSQK